MIDLRKPLKGRFCHDFVIDLLSNATAKKNKNNFSDGTQTMHDPGMFPILLSGLRKSPKKAKKIVRYNGNKYICPIFRQPIKTDPCQSPLQSG